MYGKFTKMMSKNKKGFTLVELMVVVVILGILTAIAVPVYNNSNQLAMDNAVKSNVRIIDGAITAWQAASDANVGKAPADIAALVTAGYLQAAPAGPGNATYGISATAPFHATATAAYTGGYSKS